MPDTSTKEVLGFQAEVSQLLHLMIHSCTATGDLPARAHLERLRRRRQAAVRIDERPCALRRRPGAVHPGRLRPSGADNHRVRQRHRHVPAGGRREHRHHRQVRDAGVPRPTDRRPGQGRAPHRTVRRRLLLRLHRRRPGDPGHAARRPDLRARRPLGEHRRRQLSIEAVEKITRGTDVILHLRPDEDDLLSGHRLREILRSTPTTSPSPS